MLHGLWQTIVFHLPFTSRSLVESLREVRRTERKGQGTRLALEGLEGGFLPAPRLSAFSHSSGLVRVLPAVEALEERVVPATDYWIASAAGTWETAGNWSLGRAPTFADDVVFDGTQSAASCTTNGAKIVNSLQIVNGYNESIYLNGNFTILNGGQMSGGNLWQLSGDTYLSGGNFSWRGGNIYSGDTLATYYVASGAYFNIVLTASGTFGEDIDNSGVMSIRTQGGAAVTLANNAGITNEVSAQILWDKGDILTSGTSDLDNSGLLEKTTYDSTATVTCQLQYRDFNSNSMFWIQSGTFYDSAVNPLGYSVSLASGRIQLGSQPTGGDLAGTLTVAGKFAMGGGVLRTIGSQTSAISGDVEVHGGDIWIGVGSATSTATLSLSKATGTFTMDGGTYHCTVNGSGTNSDLIQVAGSADIAGTAQIAVNVVNEAGLKAGDSYVTLNTGGGVPANTNFSSSDPVWIPPTLNDGFRLDVVYAP
jgi:hypothetical protein